MASEWPDIPESGWKICGWCGGSGLVLDEAGYLNDPCLECEETGTVLIDRPGAAGKEA